MTQLLIPVSYEKKRIGLILIFKKTLWSTNKQQDNKWLSPDYLIFYPCAWLIVITLCLITYIAINLLYIDIDDLVILKKEKKNLPNGDF
jgi:hypothetical protein